jgi:RNA polymerase sigma-70 factor (ECF subfamily)
LPNNADAYDVSTETFLKAAEKMYQLEHLDYYPLWLFLIARNNCRDLMRGRKKNQTVYLDGQSGLMAEESDHEAIIKNERRFEQLEYWMDKIAPDAKKLLTEKYINKYSIIELATQHSISPSAVKMRLSRARDMVSRMVV